MTFKYRFEITFTVSDDDLAARNISAFLGSANEFAEEMRLWIDKQPIVEGCKLAGPIIENSKAAEDQ